MAIGMTAREKLLKPRGKWVELWDLCFHTGMKSFRITSWENNPIQTYLIMEVNRPSNSVALTFGGKRAESGFFKKIAY